MVEKKEIKNLDRLIEKGILIQHSENVDLVKMNPYSTELNEAILDHCKELTDYVEPSSVEDVEALISNFRDILKEQNQLNSHRPYRPVLGGFYAFLLNLIQRKGVHIYSYALDKVRTEEVDKLTDDFDGAFMYHMFNGEYDIEEIFNFCQICALSENHYRYRQLNHELINQPLTFLKELYEYCNGEDRVQSEFHMRLSPTIFNHYPSAVFRDIFESSEFSIENKIRVLVRCNLSQANVANVLQVVKNLEVNEYNSHLINDACFLLVQKENASKEQRKQIYNLWLQLVTEAQEDQLIRIISNIRLIDNEEDELLRLVCVKTYLERTGDFSVLDSFFYYFHNPWHVFKLLTLVYQAMEGRKYHIATKFRRPLEHFFRVNPEETEKCILELFRKSHGLGSLPVDVMRVRFSSPFKVDLTKLTNEEDQLVAIRKFYYVSFDFEKVLPSLMTLWKSPYNSVVESLQSHLAELTYDTYGKDMVDWLRPYVKGKGSKIFLDPIVRAAKQSKDDLKSKYEIKDLNPAYHERDLLQTYMKLSQENQSKAMKEGRNNPGFLASMFKSSIIVRGNSAKMGCQGKITKLGSVSVSSTLDSRLYKDPDLFEFNMRDLR